MREERDTVLALLESQELEKPNKAAAILPQPSYGPYLGEKSGEEENSVREYLRAIRKHLWLIIGIVMSVTMMAAIYAARKPDIYSASTRVQVDLESNPVSGLGKNNTLVLNSPTSDPTYFNTQLQILTGPGLLRRVVKTLDLEHNEAFIRPKRENISTWESLQRLVGLGKKQNVNDTKNKEPQLLPHTESVAPATASSDLAEAKRLDPYVKALQAGLSVQPVKELRTSSYTKDTRLIDISFTHSDPQVAAKVANAVADIFTLSNMEKKTESNVSNGSILQRRVAELQSQIRSGEEQLINYAKSHQILSLDNSQNTVVERLSGLNHQLLEAENERKIAEAAYRAAQAPGGIEALAQGDAKQQLSEAEAKLSGLREKRAQLLVNNTEEWSEVKEVNQQIAVLEKRISDILNRQTGLVKTQLEMRYRQALDRENALRAAFNQQRGETLTQNEAAINYRIIQQEIDTNKELLDGLLQRSKENDVVRAGTSNNIYIVDYALTPDSPVGPQRMRDVVMAALLSLGAGFGLAIFLEFMNDSIRSTEDVERWLHLPPIGVIPGAGGLAKGRFLSNKMALQRTNGSNSSELLINSGSRSALAEAYRHLRTSVLLSTAGHAPKTLLVTSSVPSEGKTTTAVNTAYSLAQSGGSVLIIDADMRRPRLHSIFGLENRNGLSSILSSAQSEAEMLSLIVKDEESGLNLLTSGAIPPNPAELIGSEQMRRLLKAVESAFTYVVIDSPPVGSFTDGVLASTLVDGVLLVVHSGRASRQVVRRARQVLQDVGAKIFGVVLNNVNIREESYYYYYHSYYQTAANDSDMGT